MSQPVAKQHGAGPPTGISGPPGFTLVELLVTIAVLGILSGVAVLATGGFRARSQQAACAADRVTLQEAMERHRTVSGSYVTEAELVTSGELRSVSSLYDVTLASGDYTLVATGACVGVDGSAVAAAPLAASAWQVVRGVATISGTHVDMAVAGIVMAPLSAASENMTVTTQATLDSGAGYGVFIRASLDASKLISGYAFQYDQQYGNKFVLRHYYQGNECTVPIGTSAFPAAMVLTAPHKVVVSAIGDTLTASIDGSEVFRVASLSKTIAASTCGYPEMHGTGTGFRTWGTSPAHFVDTTVS